MRLISLKLTNFQGLRDAQFDFGGANVNIFGDNATGKTTVFNAVTWMLFGKASTGAKNFTPKTKGPDGDLHYLDHGVEAHFCLDDGQLLALKKIYKEEYKKMRGSSQEEFSGHVIEYFIDGVPAKEKEYKAALNNYIGPDEHMKMLMMPDYFAETLPWEQRRRILLEMCGDVSDSDVIDGNPELEDLLDYLAVPGVTGKHYSVDEYKKIAAGKRTEINRELQTLPARIDEAQKAMPDVSGLFLGPINAKVALLNSQIESKEREKQETLSGDATADTIRKEISALTTKLAEERAAYATQNSKLNEAALAEVGRLKTGQSQMRNALLAKKSDLTAKERALSTMRETRQRLYDSYQKLAAEEWQGNEECPTCKRPLPEEEIAQAKEAYNLSKSERLESINQEGQAYNKDMIAALEAEIKALAEDIQSTEMTAANYNSLILEAEKNIQQPAPFETTEAYTATMQQINDLQSGEGQTGAATSTQVSMINTAITELRGTLDKLLADKSKLTLAEQQQKRIVALEADEKRLSGEYESLQRGVYLCEEFIKAKVSMLTDRINGKFNTVRFRLFVEQINGGIKEDCEVMVPADGRMVPFMYANNAARINAGLEIINALAGHWNTSVPVFVDNAESVTRLQEIDSQLIRLVVSEPDKALRVEITN